MIATKNACIWYGGYAYELRKGRRVMCPPQLMERLVRDGLAREDARKSRTKSKETKND